MNISGYIKELLFDHDCVIVPGFGGFIASRASAEIHPVTHRFSPPGKDIAFNGSLIKDDGLLKTSVSSAEGISYEEASGRVEQFVKYIQEHLRANGFAEIPSVGRFFYNVEGKLEFEPEQKVNFNEDSYGLADFIFKPIEHNKMEQANRPPQRFAGKSRENQNKEGQKKGISAGKVLAIVIPLLLIAGTGIFFLINKDNEGMRKQFAFMSFLFDDEETTKPVEELKAPSVVNLSEKTAPDTVADISAPDYNQVAISGKQGRFSVIVGSFSRKRNAEKFMNTINQGGEHAMIIEPSSGASYYRVSIAEYNEKDAALSGLSRYRQQYQDAWLKLNN